MTKKVSPINATVTVTPTKGDPQTHPVAVSTGATVANALGAANVSAMNHDLTVNGQPAESSTVIKEGDRIGVAERTRGS